MASWTQEEITYLALNYPKVGRKAVALALNRTEDQIRSQASRLKIYHDSQSDFTKEWQKRAALSKIGKKHSEESKKKRSIKAKAAFAAGTRTIPSSQRKRMSLAQKKRIAEQGHNRGMFGKKHSEQFKKEQSLRKKKAWADMSEEKKREKTKKMIYTKFIKGNYALPRTKSTWKAAWREFGNKRHFYRSRWEANYGRYLEFLKSKNEIKEWLHEPDVFWFEGIKRGCVSYLPDFKIINLDDSIEYHEVKGWMDNRSITKINRMSKYYPEIKLIVIKRQEYNEILTKLAKLIPDWE